MNRHFAVNVSTSSSTYGFKDMNVGVVPDIMQLNSLTCHCFFNIPSTATIYATTAESTDQLVPENIIGTVVFSSGTGTVTIVNKGKALIGKTYIAVVRPDSKTTNFTVGLNFDLASTVELYDGTDWDECLVRAYNGTEFVPAQVFRYDGTQWVECTHYEPQ